MGFKEWPAWLRGGIIGLSILIYISIILSFFYLFFASFGDTTGMLRKSPIGSSLDLAEKFMDFTIKPWITADPGMIILILYMFFTALAFFLQFCIFFFIIGALVGWYVEKIKSRKENKFQFSYAEKGFVFGFFFSLIGIAITSIMGLLNENLLWPIKPNNIYFLGFLTPLRASIRTSCSVVGCGNVAGGIISFFTISLLILVLYSLLGSLVGWIVGKIKSKKESAPSVSN